MRLSASAQRNLGLLFSYFFTVINMAISLLLTPFMIKTLGAVEYGIYQMMISFAGCLLFINFGVGTIMTRYIAFYRSTGDKNREKNILGLGLLMTALIAIIVIGVALILKINMGSIYENSLTSAQFGLASTLFSYLSASAVLALFQQVYEGIMAGYERFVYISSWNIVKLILRFMIIIAMLTAGYRSLAIVSTDLTLTVITLIVEGIYCHFCLDVRIKIYYWDKTLVKTIVLFSLALFIQIIASQVNNSAGNFFVGIIIGPETVTMYSVAMAIFTMFSVFSTSAIPIFLPQATYIIEKGANGEELTDLIIQPSRVQTIISGTILLGFFLFGKQFIRIWVGTPYINAWWITITMMVPAFLYYTSGMIVSILDAMQKRMFRSLTFLGATIINVILTIFLIKKYGYMGGPLAFALTTVVGQVIIMNIYYVKIIRINIIKLFKETLRGTFICLVLATVLSLPLTIFNDYGVLSLAINILIYICLLGALLGKMGLSPKEKEIICNYMVKVKGLYETKRHILGND